MEGEDDRLGDCVCDVDRLMLGVIVPLPLDDWLADGEDDRDCDCDGDPVLERLPDCDWLPETLSDCDELELSVGDWLLECVTVCDPELDGDPVWE